MRSEWFEEFIETFGEATATVDATEEQIERYRGVLPDGLLEVWSQEGFSGYADGLFWLTNPSDYTEIVDQWIGETNLSSADNYHVIHRSAFGDLQVWGEKNNQLFSIRCSGHAIHVSESKIQTYEDPEMSVILEFLTLKKSQLDPTSQSGGSMFAEALAEFGLLGSNEMYAFEPALVLGGKLAVENMAKVRLDAHLSVLRELAPPTIRALDT